MRKIIKIILCVFCTFICIDSALSAEVADIYVDTYGNAYSFENWKGVSGEKGAIQNGWEDTSPAFRITFVDKQGKTLGQTVDYYTNINWLNGADYYYTGFKFSLFSSSNIDARYNALQTGNKKIQEMQNFVNSNNTVPSKSTNIKRLLTQKITELDEGSLNEFVLDLIENADLTNNYETYMRDENLYIVVERIFKISILTYKPTSISKTPLEWKNLGHTGAYYGCQSKPDKEACLKEPTALYVWQPINTFYIGTESQLSTVIEYFYQNRGNTTLNEKININVVDELRWFSVFGKNLYINRQEYEKLRNGGYDYGLTPVESDSNFTNIGLPKTGYGLYMAKIWTGQTEEECNIYNFYKLGQDWNPVAKMCCPVGTEYNSKTGECEEPKEEQPSSDYVFKSYTDANICSSNTTSTFSTISRCDQTSPNFHRGVPLANCVYKNQAYKDGNVYCYDEVTVETGQALENFSEVKSGAIIPINKFPTATVTKTCYSDSEHVNELKSYMINSENYDIGTIRLDAGDYKYIDYTLTPIIRLEKTSTNTITTSSYTALWYEPSYYATNTATINYNYDATLNKYINMDDYLGEDSMNSNKEQISVNNDFNITVPVSTETGEYTSSVTMSKCGAINDIYELERGFNYRYNQENCTGKCNFTYTSKTDNIDHMIDYYETLGWKVSKTNSFCEYATTYSSVEDCLEKKCKVYKDNPNYHESSYETCKRAQQSVCEEELESNCISKTSIQVTKENINESECKSAKQSNYVFTPSCKVVQFKKDSKDVSDDLTCEKNYTITNELTSDPGDPTQEYSLINKLVFRPIDLSNPFPGKDGNGRESGSNWNSDNIQKYITNRQDVYTDKSNILYSITLTPTLIKEIREYNKDKEYDDFTLRCFDGDACLSRFLREEISEAFNTNYSRCFNIETQSGFNSCTEGRW